MMRNELKDARALCAEYLDAARPVLAAVSGGLDSMCLLHFLRAQGYDVSCAHFNHRLRGEAADEDERFVRAWCGERGIPFYSGSGDVRACARESGRSIEEAARLLRYGFLRETARALGAQLVLAHHADDNAETVLLNLVRGTDLRGLCGMRPCQDGIVRPFLGQSRAELSAYAETHGIPHREDATNADPSAAARNYLRLEILPRLRTLNPRSGEHIAHTARSLAALDDALERETDSCAAYLRVGKDGVSLPLETFRAAGESVQPRILLRMADAAGIGRKDIGRRQLEAILALTRRNDHAERRFSLPRGASVRIADGELTLSVLPAPPESAALFPNTPRRWGNFELTLLPAPDGEGLLLRTPHPGETVTVSACDAGAYLRLADSNGARSVRRLCLDRHIPLSERDTLPALYVDGRLAAVWRLGTDVSFAPDGEACFVRVAEIL